ncbi:cytochrome P450 [Limibacter armeniacum]|uniref:cytochrome P450 n=1 Tax=Limibacter armeniacum TaxID=466084 RepID=UPI002FE5D2D4
MRKKIATISELSEAIPFGVDIEGVELVILKIGEQVQVFHSRCPHQQANLAEGRVEKGMLVCQMHQWKFDHQTGQRSGGKECLHKFNPIVENDNIYLLETELADWENKSETGSLAQKKRTIEDLPKMKGLPVIGNIHQFDFSNMHQEMSQVADKLGPLFRLNFAGRPVVVTNDHHMNQQLMKMRPKLFRRGKKLAEIFEEMGIEGVFSAEGEQWVNQRKVTAQALNMQHLKTFHPTLMTVTERLKNKLDSMAVAGEAINIQQEVIRYTVDVTTNLAFGYDMNTVEETGDVIQQHIEKVFPAIFRRLNAPFPYWRYVKLPVDKSFDASMKIVTETIKEFIAKAKEKLKTNPELKEKPGNFLEAMLLEQEKEGKFSEKEVVGNVFTMLLAGEDTTAHSIAWAVYFLSIHPDIQEKMYEEAKTVLKEEAYLREQEDGARLYFAEAVAMETMRMKPVAPFLYLSALEDVEIDGLEIPKDTVFLLNNRHAAWQEENFSNPDQFEPERWMPSGCPMHAHHKPEAAAPFGGGARFCPGRGLALVEIKMVLSMLCKNYRIELITDPETIRENVAFTMSPSDFEVKLHPRKMTDNKVEMTSSEQQK